MSKQKLPFFQLVRAFWNPYLRLGQYLKPYRKRFVLGLVFGSLAGVLNGIFPLVIKVAGDAILPAGQSAVNPSQLLKSGMDTGPGIEKVIWISLLIPAAMVARGIFSYLNSYCLAWVSLRVLRDIRTQLFSHLMSQSLGFFNRAKAGKLISRVMNDTRMAQNALTSISGDIVQGPIAVITGVIVLVKLDWMFSLTTLLLFPICIIPVVFFGKKVRQAGRAEENEAGQMSVILQESFAGIRVIKSFAREGYQAEQFDKSSEIQCQNSLRVRRSSDIVQPLIESVSALGVVLALMYVYFFHISFIKFAALCAGIFLLYNPVKSLSKIPMLMQKCMASATNIFDLLKLQSDIQDKPDAVVLKKSAGRIEFDRMSFSYGVDKAAVEDISLTIESGKKFALVGASGAGKSTLLSLILRFYDPQKGVIRVDGHDIRDVSQSSLHEQIGVVTQETFLFHDTIYENIRYGRLDATREQIIAASQFAYAHDFILAQPDGYETVVGDKGCLLSGGQQQRLAIARALLKNAPILLLDEATSALDSESERMIQAALERLSEGRTVIAIAHRLSTILKSDCIVVMDHGRIVATGTHHQLLESSVLYRNLYELQFHQHEAPV
ncbi:MAG: ABC transporter ATP-binding protein [Verrucomicrobiaceae bacterium]|nr:MAG: ABC transporter ATP-binding protein [Verrucomicrobiaceae bacterium]